jgi:hypothetical protein
VLAVVIIFLLVVAPIFKLRTIIKRWEDAHIPIVVKPEISRVLVPRACSRRHRGCWRSWAARLFAGSCRIGW